jgi:hypothetical protein
LSRPTRCVVACTRFGETHSLSVARVSARVLVFSGAHELVFVLVWRCVTQFMANCFLYLFLFYVPTHLFALTCPSASPTQRERTSLILAAIEGHTECVRLLLEAGAAIEATGEVCGRRFEHASSPNLFVVFF